MVAYCRRSVFRPENARIGDSRPGRSLRGGTLPDSSALGPTTGASYQKSTCGRSFRPVQVLVFILTREA